MGAKCFQLGCLVAVFFKFKIADEDFEFPLALFLQDKGTEQQNIFLAAFEQFSLQKATFGFFKVTFYQHFKKLPSPFWEISSSL